MKVDENPELGHTPSIPRRPKSWNECPGGYPAFSAFLVRDPDQTGTVFRRLDRTAARNLRCLRSELSALERKLDVLEEANIGGSIQVGARNWEKLQKYASQEVPEAVEIQDVVVGIRKKTKEYQKALVLFNKGLALAPPQRRALKPNRHAFYKGSKLDKIITDGLRNHVDDVYQQDLCALKKLPEPDRLRNLLEGSFAFLLRICTHCLDYLVYLLISKKERINGVISSILAAIFLIGAVLGLYFVDSQSLQLGMLCAFIITFTGSLTLLTNGRRQEVFAAMAAYPAVLVVFFSGDFAQDSSSGISATMATITVTLTILATETPN